MLDSLNLVIDQLHFLRPWWLLALPLGLLIVWLIKRHTQQSNWRDFVAPHLLEKLLLVATNTQRLTPNRLAILMLLIWVLALAGPSWQREPSSLLDDKSPLVIGLYLGESMLGTDLLPSRLTHAKLKIVQLLERRVGSPTALLVYGESAYSVLPLTEDTAILKSYLYDLQPDVLPRVGNQPDQALVKAAELLGDQLGSVILVADDLNGFSPAQDNWNPLASSVEVSMLMVTPPLGIDTETQQMLSLAGLNVVPATLLDADIDSLLSNVEHHWQNRLNRQSEAQWRDAGYYLLWPLLLMCLLWFRRGMVLQW